MDSMGEERQGGSWWKRNGWTFVMLVFLVLLSGFLRVAFNYGPALNDGEYRYAGNDDYYHLRVVQVVQETGDHVNVDPLLNYPAPARNPRPPLYDWHVAILGQVLGFFSGEASPGEPAFKAGQYALEWGSALWGALTVIPIWLIGRATYGNRAGLWAGFLVAASPAHIQRSGFGLGDHDAFIVFFLCLGAYFLVRALQLTRDQQRLESWTRADAIGRGFGAYAATHSEALVYALLAGICFAAIGLAWEGYPYVLAIYAIYYVFQLLSNQLRRRDSTGDFLVFAIVAGTLLAAVIPFYWITGNVHTTLNSTIYVLLILGVLSLALIPTRDLPSILVLPAVACVGLLGLVLLFLVAPDVGQQLVSANGYFNQSKLYSTIAEAQRTELGVFVFSIGFLAFFLAVIGFFMALSRYWRTKDRAQLFLVAWGLLSLYMGFAATRFIFNAAPIFAVLAGWVTVRIIDWMDFKNRLRSFQSSRQESLAKGVKSLLGAKQVAGSLFLVLFLLVPNLWFSLDAGIPSEFRANYRQNHPGARELIDNRTGAFGQGFLDPNWLVVYGWLDDQDRDVPEAQRPGHIAWWDYGFWEVAIAHHPTVADNFQNGHQLAGRFLASQSEKEAIDWLSVRLLEGDWAVNGRTFSAPVQAVLSAENPAWPSTLDAPGTFSDTYDAAARVLASELVNLDESVAFYEKLQGATGFSIQYFLVDNRMLPFDDPSTPDIESGSILYAPIFLANKNPDDFVKTVYTDIRNNQYNVVAYDVINGVSRQADPARIEDSNGDCYLVSGGLVFLATEDCKGIDYGFNNGEGVQLQGTKLVFQDAYYNTMFYKGFVGGAKPIFGDYPQEAFTGNGTAGKGLEHFRFVNGTRSVKLLQYYEGAVVRGKATLAGGGPMSGTTVVAQDPFGIDHSVATTGADGTFSVIAPFSLPGEGGVKIALKQGETVIATKQVEISRAAAQRDADYNFTVDFSVEPGTVNGFVFTDKDRSGSYNSTIDAPLSGAKVTVGSANYTTGSDGRFTASNVLPGQRLLQVTADNYNPGSEQVTLEPGGTASVNISMVAANVPVNGTLQGANGAPLGAFNVQFIAHNPSVDFTLNTTTVTSDAGFFQTSLQPGGMYTVRVNDTTLEDNKTVRYQGEKTINVPFGSDPIEIAAGDIALTRTEE